ncbi:MAG: biotin/lipoyl-binding protein [Firmicutes bacterium]|nr:biotin/lipoyl-binding protein [Bacillota bacterium]
MRRYRVTVNGNVYDVEVEEVLDEQAVGRTSQGQDAPQHVKAQVHAGALDVQEGSQAGERQRHGVGSRITAGPEPGQGTQVKAPLAGVILSVKVQVGSNVKRGDVLVTLEALKMENEIQSPADGTVSYVGVREGQDVQAGAVLVVIENA